MEQHICVFGDSTAWGAWDTEKGGWVNRLWLTLYDHEPYVELFNLSISGGTSETILARFESEATVRRATGLIFQTGGNDAAFETTPDVPQISPEVFRSNIEGIISNAKAITPNILFIGPKGSDESRSTPVSWVNLHYTNAMARQYSDILAAVCKEQNVPFLDMLGVLENSDFDDGVHPTARGHEKLFRRASEFLTQQGWI